MVDAVLFDLFGTLVHLQFDRRPYWQLTKLLPASANLRDALTVDAPTLASFCDYLQAEHPLELSKIQEQLCEDIGSARLYDDTLAVLRSVRERDVRIAIVSNLASPYKAVCQRLGLSELVDAIVFSCDVGLAKPDPRIYQLALLQLAVDADNTIMVGDSVRADVLGPEACGIRGYLLKRSSSESSGDRLNELTTLSDLIPYLDEK